jgi:hypothetical protein
MSNHLHKVSSTTVAKIKNGKVFFQLLTDSWLHSDAIITKPKWVSTDPGDFADAETFRMLFEIINEEFVVTESYCILRLMNLLKDGMNFSIGDKEVNWKGLRKGDGWNWLIENPDWEWFKQEGHWDHLKEEGKAFRDKDGLLI